MPKSAVINPVAEYILVIGYAQFGFCYTDYFRLFLLGFLQLVFIEIYKMIPGHPHKNILVTAYRAVLVAHEGALHANARQPLEWLCRYILYILFHS